MKKNNNRNFWNSCPKKLEYFPKSSCPFGQNSLSTSENIPKCDWSINSKKDHFCFWTWVRRKSSNDGELTPLMQNEIGELLMIPASKLHLELKTALENLKNTNEFKNLLQKE